jgi:phosphohistidine phosphatase SixA
MRASLAVLFVALATGYCPAADAKTYPKTILIIRHAEKPANDTDPNLSAEGKQRAKALPKLVEKTAERPMPFPTPDFIFATEKSEASNRPVETVEPLAKHLKLEIHSKIKNKDFAKLAEELTSKPKFEGKTVLVCWHHGEIQELAMALGVTDAPKFHGSVFDQVWVVTFDEKGRAKLVIRQQALMPGDKKE